MNAKWRPCVAMAMWACLALVLPRAHAAGACSPDVGRVVLNEYAHQLNFAEIKRLNVNTDITNWKIRIYSGAGSYAQRSLPALSDPSCTPPYVYQTAIFGSSETPYDADIVLLDANDDVVDILQARRNLPPTAFYTPVPSCGYISPPLYVQVDPARKGVDRMPDGIGPWRNTPGTGAGSYVTECKGNTPSGPAADLAVAKAANFSDISTGGSVTFTVTLQNNGPNIANTVIVSDLLPSGLTYASHSVTAGSYDPNSGVWAISTLASGVSRVLTLVASGTTAGSYTNTAQASSDNTDSNSANNLATATVKVGYADIAVTKTVNNTSVSAGTNVTFTILAKNNGPSTANSVVVNDLLPAGLVYQSSTVTAGSYASGSGIWTIDNMANGASATLTIVAKANSSATNSAAISSSNNVDTVPANNSASVSVAVSSGSFDAVEVGKARATNIHTKLAGTAFDLDVLALNTDNSMQTGYSGNPTVELVSVGGGACSGWASLAGVTVTSGAAWSGGRRTYAFTSTRASANTRVRVTDGGVVACSTDNFSIRPASFTVSLTKTDGTALPSLIKAGLFDMKASVQAGVAGYAGTVGFYPSQSLDQNGVAVAGRGTLTLANAVNTPILDVAATLPTPPLVDGEVFASTSSGVATVLPNNAAYDIALSPVTGFRYHDAGSLTLAIRDKTFTAVDRHALPGVDDCLADSASNALASGKYGCDVGGDTTISRFVPDHFTVNGNFTPACVAGGGSYMDQLLGIDLTVSARSAREITSTLYGNACPVVGSCKVSLAAYNGTTALDIGRFRPLSGFPVGTSYDAAATPKLYNSTSWVNGEYRVSGTNFYVARDTIPDGAFDHYLLKAVIADPDGVTISGSSQTSETRIRYGRLWLGNAYGSEKRSLNLPYETQYWNGNAFVRNALDVCTALTTANFGIGNLKPSGFNPAGYSSPVTAISMGSFSTGSGSITLAAPNVSGSTDVVLKLGASLSMCPSWTPAYPSGTPVSADYLRGKWCGSGYDKDPVARATFGISGGSAKKGTIYLRENY